MTIDNLAGSRVSKPNLFLVGAMKSGTTTLHDLLAAHPEISMCDPKEPSYFVEPRVLETHWPEMWRLGFWQDEAKYLGIFPEKRRAKYFGESSTDYSKRPAISGAVERIADYSPDARIIYIMRDPVERTISHYWHMVEHRGETRAPLEAISHERHFTDVSNYAYQIEPYISRFGAERVYALTFETLRHDPDATLRALQTWLGVGITGVVENAVHASNVTPEQVTAKRIGVGWLDRFRNSVVWNHIGPRVPPSLRRLGVGMVERKVARREVDMSKVIAYLRPIQRQQTAELISMLGRRFDEWKTLYGE